MDNNEADHLTSKPAGQSPKSPQNRLYLCGAGSGNRTPDLFITSESLCRLS